MQSLPVAERLFPAILSGEKTHTIRWREPRIVPGPMEYVCESTDRRVVVEVTRVWDVALRDAAALVGMQAAWPPDVMLAGKRAHYPQIKLGDMVLVVEHLPPV
ncbi:hypothetical protein U879_05930 [Defluviimonas sp. 20V17]|uniref:ASCH domain-containing protein n=1 Tax=Allgaiera indica TaxID=765699 RepID=A0AAN4ZZN3_9RHOB|nr:ASCH domain-containing protein [Allgaiera indica]KDB04609.1 hypothetical protein U879_05930 [Defluviimonas sp. 20V17]GHE02595.1 hypothetical protein GCM10008024_22770 [Allgaiera indica]SDX85266.1 ASCH domain-containing protein [Allgaiera indica]